MAKQRRITSGAKARASKQGSKPKGYILLDTIFEGVPPLPAGRVRPGREVGWERGKEGVTTAAGALRVEQRPSSSVPGRGSCGSGPFEAPPVVSFCAFDSMQLGGNYFVTAFPPDFGFGIWLGGGEVDWDRVVLEW